MLKQAKLLLSQNQSTSYRWGAFHHSYHLITNVIIGIIIAIIITIFIIVVINDILILSLVIKLKQQSRHVSSYRFLFKNISFQPAFLLPFGQRLTKESTAQARKVRSIIIIANQLISRQNQFKLNPSSDQSGLYSYNVSSGLSLCQQLTMGVFVLQTLPPWFGCPGKKWGAKSASGTTHNELSEQLFLCPTTKARASHVCARTLQACMRV